MPLDLRILCIKQRISVAYMKYLTRRLIKKLDKYEKKKKKYESHLISKREHLNNLVDIIENRQEQLTKKANKCIEELNTRKRIIKFKGVV